MAKIPSPIIFSDLDGTFLDSGYRPALPRAALARVQARRRVIWASSRTAAELLHFQQTIGHVEDAIGENGGVIICRDQGRAERLGDAEPLGDAWVVRLAAPAEVTAALVHTAFVAPGLTVRTAHDLGANELALRSHYEVADAERALDRQASVLLADIEPDDEATIAAVASLVKQGCAVSSGGRWTSVVLGSTKGAAASRWLSAVSDPPPADIAAIGDTDDDESLLRLATRAFVIRAPGHGHAARLAAIPGAYLAQCFGTAGWIEMLDELDTRQGRSA